MVTISNKEQQDRAAWLISIYYGNFYELERKRCAIVKNLAKKVKKGIKLNQDYFAESSVCAAYLRELIKKMKELGEENYMTNRSFMLNELAAKFIADAECKVNYL